jgi:hypothetical protein
MENKVLIERAKALAQVVADERPRLKSRRITPPAERSRRRLQRKRRRLQRRRLHGASRSAAGGLSAGQQCVARFASAHEASRAGLGLDRRQRFRSITIRGEQEYPKQVTLTITERGYHDDAVEGVVMRYCLEKSSDG